MKTPLELRGIETILTELMHEECRLWNKHIYNLQKQSQEILASLDIRERLAMSPQFRTRSFQFDSEGKKYVSINLNQSTEIRDPNTVADNSFLGHPTPQDFREGMLKLIKQQKTIQSLTDQMEL